MPIRPENKHRYPKNWKEIRAKILLRAGNKCEGVYGACGLQNGQVVKRFQNQRLEFKLVKIVLTIAHLDHTPENNDPVNLKALCQQCHNRYDAKHRAANRRARASLEPDGGVG